MIRLWPYRKSLVPAIGVAYLLLGTPHGADAQVPIPGTPGPEHEVLHSLTGQWSGI
jgi:hypothetical protein